MTVGVGIIGAGSICPAYLENLVRFPDLTVPVIGDIRPTAAAALAAEFTIPESGGPGAVLSHPDVEIVLNLTTPAAHAEITAAALDAGKHVYSEKPIALDPRTSAELLATAERAGLRLGCAPDTVLGAGIRTALDLIQDGSIGIPLSGLSLFQSPGPECWHPNPEFLFQEGAGPLFDMGPYFLTTLVHVFGPVATVAATASVGRPVRTVGSGPRAGTTFDVDTATHISMLIQFLSGQHAQATFSFDSPLFRTDFVEITGTDATLALPDPNRFGGELLRLGRSDTPRWETIPLAGASVGRGIGVLDMARAIRAGEPHRASADIAHHVLETMSAAAESARTTSFVDVTSKAEPTVPLPAEWDPFARTL
ncbi:Gfo/Idh/MocA family protein [Pseudonocardia sp. TRM90224]|uniref:Gfo/Idh/MocA family protein n=1 Tax=Pseudonocardia sp. TRM90224 TaxID=2812678 RepID=UPI001E2AA592|nr:Gfo/Idh/MocA family oxidoreductase [Pseudonocardia sp. TRM90224]